MLPYCRRDIRIPDIEPQQKGAEMRTEIIFSFDTEDYTSQRNADAILALANMFSEEDVPAHFAVVGLVAQQLSDWGRTDVIEAMRPHLIGFHSYRHTMHPTMAEMCDREDCSEATAEMEKLEQKGLDLLHRVFDGKPVMFAVPPGMDVAYPALYFYARSGIPFYFGGYINDRENTLIDYCGMTQIPYTCSLEEIFLSKNPPDLDALLDRLSRRRRIILFHHPNMSVKKIFWDKLNYDQRNKREFGDWIDAPDRTLGETVAFWSRFRGLIRRLKQDPRFVITDANQVLAERKSRLAGPILPAALPALADELQAGLAPLKSAAYSVSDVFCAAAAFLQGKDSYTPGAAAKGFLREPHGIERETVVSAASVRAEARKIALDDYIPEDFVVDGCRIGAGDMLFAMAAALKDGSEKITLTPRRQTVDISELDELTVLDLKGKWLFSPALEDKYLSDRLRLQAWTWRKYGI